MTLNVDHIAGYQHWSLSFSVSSRFLIAERVLRVRSLLALFKKIWTWVAGR